jgi:hypothetical protein
MCSCILALGCGEAGSGCGICEGVEGEFVNFRDASAEEGTNKELETFEFCLEYDEAEIDFRVWIACLVLYEFNLAEKGSRLAFLYRLWGGVVPPRTRDTSRRLERVTKGYKTEPSRTCLLMAAKTLSISSSGKGRISGATRSATHARVKF